MGGLGALTFTLERGGEGEPRGVRGEAQYPPRTREEVRGPAPRTWEPRGRRQNLSANLGPQPPPAVTPVPSTGLPASLTPVAGPYIVYMLQEIDILEDWTAIKKVGPGPLLPLCRSPSLTPALVSAGLHLGFLWAWELCSALSRSTSCLQPSFPGIAVSSQAAPPTPALFCCCF